MTTFSLACESWPRPNKQYQSTEGTHRIHTTEHCKLLLCKLWGQWTTRSMTQCWRVDDSDVCSIHITRLLFTLSAHSCSGIWSTNGQNSFFTCKICQLWYSKSSPKFVNIVSLEKYTMTNSTVYFCFSRSIKTTTYKSTIRQRSSVRHRQAKHSYIKKWKNMPIGDRLSMDNNRTQIHYYTELWTET